MKAITIYPDWMMLFMSGEKTAEFRTWETRHRGEILLCSGAKKIPGCISGHALMVGTLTDVVRATKKNIDECCLDSMPKGGGYVWHFDNLRYIKPIPVKGMPGLFDLDVTPEILSKDASDEDGAKFFDEFIYPLIFEPVHQ